MKCLNLQDHQAKTHNYGKGLAYLRNRATTSQNQTLHSQKMKEKTLKQIITGDYPSKKKKKKKKKKKGRKESHRINWNTRFKWQ